MNDTRTPVHVGTSGWIYQHWKRIFYPDRLPQSKWFDFYAGRFRTVEINFTFYRLPARQVFESWNTKAPEEFRFAVKGSQYVTHMKRLSDPRSHVDLFFERAEPLRPHIGPVLWQLPPSFKRDDGRLAGFLDVLPGNYKHAIEFRHDSWFDDAVFEILRSQDVAICIADSTKRPGRVIQTAGWTYVRFHEGKQDGDYTDEQLDHWGRQIALFRQNGIEVWAYFNNDPHGYAIKNALALIDRLDRSR